MAFDTKKFQNRKYETRYEDVPVKELSDYFDEGEDPVWKIKGLTGAEMGCCKQSAQKDKALESTIGLLASENVSEKIKGLSDLLDIGVKRERAGDMPERIHRLVMGSIEPECTIDLAVKLSKTYPSVFYDLTNRIMILSGKGMVPQEITKKPGDSSTA